MNISFTLVTQIIIIFFLNQTKKTKNCVRVVCADDTYTAGDQTVLKPQTSWLVGREQISRPTIITAS